LPRRKNVSPQIHGRRSTSKIESQVATCTVESLLQSKSHFICHHPTVRPFTLIHCT
jgi:hypothetical protein